jgi:hypothetical protein
VSLAAANAALVAVILPEAQPAGAQAGGQRLRADQLWEQRRNESMKAVPGAVVIPYFGDPLSAADSAMSKLGN